LVLVVSRDVAIVVCGLALFMFVFRRRLGISWREFRVGIIGGLALFSFTHLMVALAMSNATLLNRHALRAIDSGGYAMATLIWLGYALWATNVSCGGTAGSHGAGESWRKPTKGTSGLNGASTHFHSSHNLA
jgi:hypothetical protein